MSSPLAAWANEFYFVAPPAPGVASTSTSTGPGHAPAHAAVLPALAATYSTRFSVDLVLVEMVNVLQGLAMFHDNGFHANGSQLVRVVHPARGEIIMFRDAPVPGATEAHKRADVVALGSALRGAVSVASNDGAAVADKGLLAKVEKLADSMRQRGGTVTAAAAETALRQLLHMSRADETDLAHVQFLAAGGGGCVGQYADGKGVVKVVRVHTAYQRAPWAEAVREVLVSRDVRATLMALRTMHSLDPDGVFSVGLEVGREPADAGPRGVYPHLLNAKFREACPGMPAPTLGLRMRAGGLPMAWSPFDTFVEFAEALGPVLHGLYVLHQHGTFHGDVSPANIIRDGPHFKLIDFDNMGVVRLTEILRKTSPATFEYPYWPPELVLFAGEQQPAALLAKVVQRSMQGTETKIPTGVNGLSGVTAKDVMDAVDPAEAGYDPRDVGMLTRAIRADVLEPDTPKALPPKGAPVRRQPWATLLMEGQALDMWGLGTALLAALAGDPKFHAARSEPGPRTPFRRLWRLALAMRHPLPTARMTSSLASRYYAELFPAIRAMGAGPLSAVTPRAAHDEPSDPDAVPPFVAEDSRQTRALVLRAFLTNVVERRDDVKDVQTPLYGAAHAAALAYIAAWDALTRPAPASLGKGPASTGVPTESPGATAQAWAMDVAPITTAAILRPMSLALTSLNGGEAVRWSTAKILPHTRRFVQTPGVCEALSPLVTMWLRHMLADVQLQEPFASALGMVLHACAQEP